MIRRTALAVALFAAIGFATVGAAAEDTTGVGAQHVQEIVDVRDVRADPDQVSGVLVNLSSKQVHGVRLRIERAWLWTDERHPAEDSPGRSTVYEVPGDIPPGGRLTFTYRSDTPLPRRSDGRFETSVRVIGVEQTG